jgi:hypothetical protein
MPSARPFLARLTAGDAAASGRHKPIMNPMACADPVDLCGNLRFCAPGERPPWEETGTEATVRWAGGEAPGCRGAGFYASRGTGRPSRADR